MTTTDLSLTSEQVKALRNADHVSFHFDTPGVCYVRASKNVDPGDGFGDRSVHVEIPAESQFTVYERSGCTGRRDVAKAFWPLGAAKFVPQWVTAARHFKAGDRLVLHWTTGDVTREQRDAGFTLVSFDVIAVRTLKGGRQERHVFMLGASATETKLLSAYVTFEVDPEYTIA